MAATGKAPDARTLHAILAAQALKDPDRRFILTESATLTYGEADKAVNRFANGLLALGVGKEDRVALYMGSRPEYVIVVLAVNRIGAIWVPVNTDYRGEWLADAIGDSMPSLLITEGALFGHVATISDRLDLPRIVVLDEAGDLKGRAMDYAHLDGASDQAPPPVEVQTGDTAAILWTSGTTGRPKGVMQSHATWINACEHGNRNHGTTEDDVAYCCLPFYNSAAWVSSIFRAMVAGIPVAIDPRFSVGSFWDRIRRYGATQTMCLGAMHMFLLNVPEQPGDADNPLRVAALTPLPETMVDPFCNRFGVQKILQGYGQSEVMTLLQRSYEPGGPDRNNALGRVCPDFELHLVDDEGNEVADGTAGEFAVRPLRENSLFNGYFNNPDANAEAFRNGLYHTGDLGMRDPAGEYYFVDRKKDYIRYKGRSVSSFEVERVANKHPAVAQSAAFGITSMELESEAEIKLDVVLKPGEVLSAEELARFINDNAPHFIVPRYIDFLSVLPHTPTSKVEKYKLRERGVGPQTWDRIAVGFELAR